MQPAEPTDQERPFDAGTYLYTRTDGRGVIGAANASFISLSGYSVERALGAPHRILRHPDMPRGVFHLMWQHLQAGRPFSGFVKNLAADGRYYWTCAIMSPADDGYISVRTKPQGPRFDQARDLYAALLADEAAGASPAQSAALLLGRLVEAGYASIEDFMGEALAETGATKAHSDCPVARMRALRAEMLRLDASRRDLLATLRKLYLIPTNMRILASRLEPSGGPVSAISDSYKRAAAELMARLNQRPGNLAMPGRSGTNGESGPGTSMVSHALFCEAAAAILAHAEQRFATEAELPGLDAATEAKALGAMVRRFRDEAAQAGAEMASIVSRIGKEAEQIKRLMSGLDQIRILGEVESGRIRNADGGLAAIMSQLTSFHGLIHSRLATMTTVANRMRAGIG